MRSRAEPSSFAFSAGDGSSTRSFGADRCTFDSFSACQPPAVVGGLELRSALRSERPFSGPGLFDMSPELGGGEIHRRARVAPVCADESAFGLRVTTARLVISAGGIARRLELLRSLSPSVGAAAAGAGMTSGKPPRAPRLIHSETSRPGIVGRAGRSPRANPSTGRIVIPWRPVGRPVSLPGLRVPFPGDGYCRCAWLFPRGRSGLRQRSPGASGYHPT